MEANQKGNSMSDNLRVHFGFMINERGFFAGFTFCGLHYRKVDKIRATPTLTEVTCDNCIRMVKKQVRELEQKEVK